MQLGENQTRALLSPRCTWLMHNPFLCNEGCLNSSFAIGNCPPAHWWHILKWIAKINKVFTKISLIFYLKLGSFGIENLTCLLLKEKKKIYLQLNRERKEGNTTTLGNAPYNVAHPCKNQALRCMWLIPDGASFKHLILDPLLYQQLPVICRGKQHHELFQHTQNLTIFLFVTIRIQCQG